MEWRLVANIVYWLSCLIKHRENPHMKYMNVNQIAWLKSCKRMSRRLISIFLPKRDNIDPGENDQAIEKSWKSVIQGFFQILCKGYRWKIWRMLTIFQFLPFKKIMKGSCWMVLCHKKNVIKIMFLPWASVWCWEKLNRTATKDLVFSTMLDRRPLLESKGLLPQMLPLPEDWDYTLKGLSSINKETFGSWKSRVYYPPDKEGMNKARWRVYYFI